MSSWFHSSCRRWSLLLFVLWRAIQCSPCLFVSRLFSAKSSLIVLHLGHASHGLALPSWRLIANWRWLVKWRWLAKWWWYVKWWWQCVSDYQVCQLAMCQSECFIYLPSIDLLYNPLVFRSSTTRVPKSMWQKLNLLGLSLCLVIRSNTKAMLKIYY